MSEVVAESASSLAARWPRADWGVWRVGLLAAATWFAAAIVTAGSPDVYDLDYTPLLTWIQSALGIVLLVASFAGERLGQFGRRLRYAGAWLIAIGLVFVVGPGLFNALGW